MNIKMAPAAWVGQQVFPTIQEAQRSELVAVFRKPESDPKFTPSEAEVAANCLLANSDEVVAILTCTPKERKPRADRGGTHRKPRKQSAAKASLPTEITAPA